MGMDQAPVILLVEDNLADVKLDERGNTRRNSRREDVR